jgi:hypothetical protein|uniref:Uncharacterized protein n=1 Tax=Zea mays TaxID=4577 RepID=A0A804QID2_MAIZE
MGAVSCSPTAGSSNGCRHRRPRCSIERTARSSHLSSVPRARTRLTARKSTGPRGRPIGQITSTSTATVAVDATSSSSDDERIALVLGDGVQQRLPTPTPDDDPSGTVSPSTLLSPSGNRVVRRLAHHLSPRAPWSWSATARPSDDDDVRERSRSPPRRLL